MKGEYLHHTSVLYCGSGVEVSRLHVFMKEVCATIEELAGICDQLLEKLFCVIGSYA